MSYRASQHGFHGTDEGSDGVKGVHLRGKVSEDSSRSLPLSRGTSPQRADTFCGPGNWGSLFAASEGCGRGACFLELPLGGRVPFEPVGQDRRSTIAYTESAYPKNQPSW